jgi:peptidyl-prolyl cis-trans isomerase C
MKKILSIALLLSLVSFGCFASAAELSAKTDTDGEFSFFASVNGVYLSEDLLELNVKNAVAAGQTDTPTLRNNLKQELINRELLAQEATRIGLDKKIDLNTQYLQLKQTLLVQAMVQDYLSSHPMTNAVLQAEYERQIKELGGSGTASMQYRLSQIVVGSQSSALGLISRIGQGDSFEKLAREYSIDAASKKEGGQIGWVSLGQLPTEISSVVSTLSKGSSTTTPISFSGSWFILKLDDKREVKTKSFSQSKPQLEQAIIQNYLLENVKMLRQRARIIQ